MARFGLDQSGTGELDIRESASGGVVEGYFIPNVSPDEGTPAAERLAVGVKLVAYSPEESAIRVFPTNTLEGHDDYLGPKYSRIRTIVVDLDADPYLDGQDLGLLLEDLPSGFIKDFRYGLGLLKDCNRLIHLVEDQTACDTIHISLSHSTGVLGSTFNLNLGDFDEIWAEIGRINSRGNRAAARVKDAFVHNSLAQPLGLQATEFSLGRHPVSLVIAKAAGGVEELTEQEQDALIGTFTAGSAAIAKSRPEKFLKLHREIELVSLDRLIEAYDAALKKSHNESYWQAFFDGNAFALQQVFGAPLVCVQSRATVGGGTLTGAGDTIADYLYKNSLTNNLALVEIKKPSTPLLRTTEYRSGVFGPSRELNGAVTQVLDQAYQLTVNLPALKHNSRQWDLESYAVSCFVVAGTTPSADEPAKQKSFELYRANSRTVTIVTYDEIGERLRLLRDFLAGRPSGDED